MRSRVRSIVAIPVAAGALVVATATQAPAADPPPGADTATLAHMADAATAPLRTGAHRAVLDVTLSGGLRAAPGSPLESGRTSRTVVRQTIATPRRSIGTLTGMKGTQRIVTLPGIAYLSGGEYGKRTVWARPAQLGFGWMLIDPASPVFRLPSAANLGDISAVPGEPGPFIRLRGAVADDTARTFVRGLQLGKSTRPADRTAVVDGARFEQRTTDLVIDPSDGHLVETDLRLTIAIDLNLISDWSQPTTGDVVINITSKYVPSPAGATPIVVRRPSAATNIVVFEGERTQDATAKSLLRNAAIAMLSHYSDTRTYRVSLAELAKIEPNIRWVVRTAAKSTRNQVEVVWANDHGFMLATTTGGGKLYTFEQRPNGTAHHGCALRGRSCGSW